MGFWGVWDFFFFRCKSHNIKNYKFLVIFMLWNYPNYLISAYFYHPIKNPIAVSSHFQFSPSPWQTIIYFLWIYLFCKSHINGIIKYAVYCMWLLWLSIFSWFNHVVAYISPFVPFYGWIYGYNNNIYPWVDGHLDCFHVLAILNTDRILLTTNWCATLPNYQEDFSVVHGMHIQWLIVLPWIHMV